MKGAQPGAGEEKRSGHKSCDFFDNEKLKCINSEFQEKLRESPDESSEKSRNFLRIIVDIFGKKRIIPRCMDTLIKRGSLGIDDLKELEISHIIVGTKQLRKRLDRGGVRRVYLARNADPAITAPLEARCIQLGVEYTWVRSMQDLGRACGIEVGAAAAATVAE